MCYNKNIDTFSHLPIVKKFKCEILTVLINVYHHSCYDVL